VDLAIADSILIMSSSVPISEHFGTARFGFVCYICRKTHIEKRNEREKWNHIHRLALALQVAGVPECFAFREPRSRCFIASVEGPIWKIWVLQEDEFEKGDIYIFANRKAAEAYLNHALVQAVRLNPML
jgi:hypothetical protein